MFLKNKKQVIIIISTKICFVQFSISAKIFNQENNYCPYNINRFLWN